MAFSLLLSSYVTILNVCVDVCPAYSVFSFSFPFSLTPIFLDASDFCFLTPLLPCFFFLFRVHAAALLLRAPCAGPHQHTGPCCCYLICSFYAPCRPEKNPPRTSLPHPASNTRFFSFLESRICARYSPSETVTVSFLQTGKVSSPLRKHRVWARKWIQTG